MDAWLQTTARALTGDEEEVDLADLLLCQAPGRVVLVLIAGALPGQGRPVRQSPSLSSPLGSSRVGGLGSCAAAVRGCIERGTHAWLDVQKLAAIQGASIQDVGALQPM